MHGTRLSTRLIRDSAQLSSAELALATSLNRETGARDAHSSKYLKLQRGAVKRYAVQIIALARSVARLAHAAQEPLTGLHAKGHPHTHIVVSFAALLAADRALTATVKPSAR